jgi:hypothetical protein
MESILTAIDNQISDLQQVRSLLLMTPGTAKKRLGRPPATSLAMNISAQGVSKVKRKKRKMSAEGRARIVSAQKARWAKIRKSSKP